MKNTIVLPTLVPKPSAKPSVVKSKRTVKAKKTSPNGNRGSAPKVTAVAPAAKLLSSNATVVSKSKTKVLVKQVPGTGNARTQASRSAVQLAPRTITTTKPTILPVTPKTTAALRSVWYLGGNQIVKLLTSVEGDLDHHVLSKIAEVPSVVGDLALSVESLVSDDVTVGGFESDLLAKIASNTLAAKRAGPIHDTPTPVAKAQAPTSITTSDPPSATPVDSAPSGTVPNPLADYEPVPNPLARITPPASPQHDSPLSAKIQRKPSTSVAATALKVP